MPVSSADVEALLDTPSAAVDAAIAQVTVMARAFTRGRGFDDSVPNEELSAVITTASARLAANGRQTLARDRVDDVEREIRSSFVGWTLAELAVLNRYRVTAM